MTLTSTLDALSDGTLPRSFQGLRSHVNEEWIEAALAQGVMARVRRRKLPAADVVWLVIGISLYRDRPMVEVVHRLDLVLPGRDGKMASITKGAIPQARERVGVEPLKRLFEITARHWAWKDADHERWRNLMILGADGSTLRVSDSPENRNAFRLPQGSGRSAGYPQVRVAVLMALRSRVWMDFDFADNRTGGRIQRRRLGKRTMCLIAQAPLNGVDWRKSNSKPIWIVAVRIPRTLMQNVSEDLLVAAFGALMLKGIVPRQFICAV